MTSWRYMTHLFVFVFLSKINLSKEGCYDYFNINSWAKNLTETISLVKTKHSKDIVECTVERECLRGREICHILYHCFGRTVKVQNISEKCEGDTSQTVPYYHFMCLTAKAFLTPIPKGCEYGTVCELYPERLYTVSDQTTPPPTTAPTTPPPTTAPTTTPPPTTAPTTTPTTTLPPTTTTPPERTTAATTVLPPTAPATTALPLKATSLPSSPTTVAQRAGSRGNGQTSHFKDGTDYNNAENTENLTLKILLMISVVLHVVVPVALYLYLRPQRRQNHTDLSGIFMSNGASSEAHPMSELESNTLLASRSGDEVETSHLMQPRDCDSVISHSVHMSKDDSVGNNTLL
ncbi:uncharacterized protein LOC143333546 isoform X1 [Chaetodon auriga]|uniref:uncharacterized protein LOC143333546 isoform X1 n=1 Tax=Chaetodon auriga TaxID=39042 RepID=UPI0040330AB2